MVYLSFSLKKACFCYTIEGNVYTLRIPQLIRQSEI